MGTRNREGRGRNGRPEIGNGLRKCRRAATQEIWIAGDKGGRDSMVAAFQRASGELSDPARNGADACS